MSRMGFCVFNNEFAKEHGIDAAIVHEFLCEYKYMSNIQGDENDFPSESFMTNQFPFWDLEHIYRILLYLKKKGLR